MRDYQERDKFFYAAPALFPQWPYPSRLAIGMRFADFKAMKAPTFNFKVKGKTYSITREKAMLLGNKYVFHTGKLPNLIPKEEFEEQEAPDTEVEAALRRDHQLREEQINLTI